jgi:hypothetical protein
MPQSSTNPKFAWPPKPLPPAGGGWRVQAHRLAMRRVAWPSDDFQRVGWPSLLRLGSAVGLWPPSALGASLHSQAMRLAMAPPPVIDPEPQAVRAFDVGRGRSARWAVGRGGFPGACSRCSLRPWQRAVAQPAHARGGAKARGKAGAKARAEAGRADRGELSRREAPIPGAESVARGGVWDIDLGIGSGGARRLLLWLPQPWCWS